MSVCEVCNYEVKYTASTSFHGHYCEDCIRLAIAEDQEALMVIKIQREADKLREVKA